MEFKLDHYFLLSKKHYCLKDNLEYLKTGKYFVKEHQT